MFLVCKYRLMAANKGGNAIIRPLYVYAYGGRFLLLHMPNNIVRMFIPAVWG